MTDVNDPVRRLLKQIVNGRPSDVLPPLIAHVHAVTPDVARKWLALPEQLQQARDAMRWRKASEVRDNGMYAFALDAHNGAETVEVANGHVIYDCGGIDQLEDFPDTVHFLGPLPEVPGQVGGVK